MWSQFFKSILNLLCGVSQQAPPTTSSGQGQQHRPNNQQSSTQHQSNVHHPSTGQQWQSGSPPSQVQSQDQYAALRAQANEQGDLMSKAFKDSHDFYSRGYRAEAKDLSNQGKEHQRKMHQLNQQASDFIYTENNKDRKPDEIDLHGLYVKEAISRADQAIEHAKKNGQQQINFIVGKGLHSSGGVAKIKPAIEELLKKHQLTAQLDPDNAGVLIVLLQTHGQGMNADEISRRIERNDEGCTIM